MRDPTQEIDLDYFCFDYGFILAGNNSFCNEMDAFRHGNQFFFATTWIRVGPGMNPFWLGMESFLSAMDWFWSGNGFISA